MLKKVHFQSRRSLRFAHPLFELQISEANLPNFFRVQIWALFYDISSKCINLHTYIKRETLILIIFLYEELKLTS